MPDTVAVTIDVDAAVAPALQDQAKRASAGRLVSRMLQPASVKRLFRVMDAIGAEAKQRGLTDDDLDAELETYNAERRASDATSNP